MNNLNCPLKVRKNKPPSVFFFFFEKISDGTENKKENIENNLVLLCFVSNLEKHLQSNQYWSRSVFRNPSHNDG